MALDTATLRNDLVLLCAAGAGGAALHAAGLPAGLMTGAMAGVLLTRLAGPVRDLSRPLAESGMLLSGLVIGASATPEALRAAMHYPGSILLLLLSVALTVAVTGLFLVRFARWSPLDALLGAAPGAFSAVVAIAREKSQRLGDIAVIQLVRLFLLVAAAPSAMTLMGASAGARGAAMPDPSWPDTAVMIAAGLALAWLFRRIGVMSPMVLGGTVASVVLHAADLVHGGLPAPLAMMAFVILGAMIGCRIVEISLDRLKALMPAAFGALVASMAVALILAWPAAMLAKVSYAAAFIAFAPGGLEAMALLAVALGLDPLYVGSHHVVRFMAVGFLLPLAAAVALRMPDRGRAESARQGDAAAPPPP
jgi:hypothetical protein